MEELMEKKDKCFNKPQSLVDKSLAEISRKLLESPPEILEMVVKTTKEKLREEIVTDLNSEMVDLLNKNKSVIRDIVILVLEDLREIRYRNYEHYFFLTQKDIVNFAKSLAEEIDIFSSIKERTNATISENEWENNDIHSDNESSDSYIDYA